MNLSRINITRAGWLASAPVEFVVACRLAGIPRTTRQVSKWARHRGAAYAASRSPNFHAEVVKALS